MFYFLQFICLLAIFLVPHSQAVISDNHDANMTLAGYYCKNHSEIRTINIIYSDKPQGLPCQVTFQKNSTEVMQLLEAKRNVEACKNKAVRMASRLRDRGWQCQSSGI